jgi:hypothetical protein
MTNMLSTYVDPIAMRNIDAERRELALDSLRPRASSPVKSNQDSIGWWVLQYETAGHALMHRSNAPVSGR